MYKKRQKAKSSKCSYNRTPQPLPPAIKDRILVLAGQFKKPREIVQIIREDNPKAFYSEEAFCLDAATKRILGMNKEYVYALKEQYSKSIMEVPIAHKKVRLERLECLYDEARKPSERREILKAAREELEGVRVNLNMYQMNFFGGMTDAELAKREREIIDRVQSFARGEGKATEEERVSVLPATSEAEVVSSV